MHSRKRTVGPARKPAGFTLVELMIAMAIGIFLSIAMGAVFLSTRQGAARQNQLSSVQQSIRTAFDFLTRDVRAAGDLGCWTGRSAGNVNRLTTGSILARNFEIGVQGFHYNLGGTTFTPSADAAANSTDGSEWTTNTATNGILNLTLTDLSADGLTPGSDVVVIRTTAGPPVRLTADAATGAGTVTIDNIAGGTCSDGVTAKVSGLCANSNILISSCTTYLLTTVAGTPTTTVALTDAIPAAQSYTANTTEVFPMQSVAYYVKASSSGTTTSLYRRIFDGDNGGGLEQELVEGVEMMQVRYGVDSLPAPPNGDGVMDGAYMTADLVADWTQVVAVRMSLLLRAADALEGGVTAPTTSTVAGITVTHPSTRYDRRVFTTTVAVRNRISH